MFKYATFNGRLKSLWSSDSSLNVSIALIVDLPGVNKDSYSQEVCQIMADCGLVVHAQRPSLEQRVKL